MTYTFDVPDMNCNHCEMRVTKALGDAGATGVRVDLDERKVTAVSDGEAGVLMEALDEAGYPATLAE